jgi:hypothetical protein
MPDTDPMERPPTPASYSAPPQPTAEPSAVARPDYDSPWKEAIEQYFEAFLAFFFPRVHADIDWDKGYEFLNTELERVVRDATLGRRYADELVKVFLRDGTETWLLIHIEVQGYPERALNQRLYVYNYRIFDRYGVDVVTLVVLTEDIPASHTRPYRRARWGWGVLFRFPVARVRDLGRDWAALEQSRNPFAVVVMAHLTARNVQEGAARKQAKLQLIRSLYTMGYSREEILALFRFIDWLLVLPAALEQEFWEEFRRFEEAQRMPYITSVERIGMQKGFEQGLQQGLQQGLREAQDMVCEAVATRFGTVPDDILAAVRRLEGRETLHALLRQAIICPTIDALREALPTVQES